ncbi:inorganic phosphate transporter [Vreelandella utahensis]|uniref:inorganic phosphate transporter n=1 Tax=Vreelandella halophila TaxID=86177 RepID=UPI0009856236|nr:inorganic phosphate transporter [Halomonas utahensis]
MTQPAVPDATADYLASDASAARLFRLGVGSLFLLLIWAFMHFGGLSVPGSPLLLVAALFGGYMAMNIGANDVANNVGPSVGSGALTMTGAVIIAAIFEAAGALIAGGEVISTIKGGIINPEMVGDPRNFIWLMTGAVLAGAMWLNLATILGAPVSTTHSIVGGVLGAGLAAGGLAIANWGVMASIVASWVISPMLGGLISAAFLYLIKLTVLYKQDRVMAARRVVPWLIAVMAWAFATYLVIKALPEIWDASFLEAAGVGLLVAAAAFLIVRASIVRQAATMANSTEGVNGLFTIPLIFAAALLSFAHGANDVANAIGPVAAINEAITSGDIAGQAPIPLWVMLLGAVGLAVGLALYGPRLIKTVGSEITELDKTRAYCIALAAAITVIIASQLGLPVSSTHIALGAVFGVGFLREFLKTNYASRLHGILEHHQGNDREQLQAFLDDFRRASIEEMEAMIRQTKEKQTEVRLKKKERKRLKKIYQEEMVKRHLMLKIVAAWVITVPASGLLAAMFYFTLRGIFV